MFYHTAGEDSNVFFFFLKFPFYVHNVRCCKESIEERFKLRHHFDGSGSIGAAIWSSIKAVSTYFVASVSCAWFPVDCWVFVGGVVLASSRFAKILDCLCFLKFAH
jgi:hypothetical protein